MAYLEEISNYKNTILQRIVSDQELCKAVQYNDKNFLDKADIDDTTTLIYDRIFPYKFIPDTNTEEKTFITLSVGRFQYVNNSFKEGLIIISIFTHRDLFRTDYSKTRVDFILNKIDSLLNYKSGIGLGKLEFDMLDEIAVNDKFQGAYVCYRPIDFN